MSVSKRKEQLIFKREIDTDCLESDFHKVLLFIAWSVFIFDEDLIFTRTDNFY